jgi:hypothetical protein
VQAVACQEAAGYIEWKAVYAVIQLSMESGLVRLMETERVDFFNNHRGGSMSTFKSLLLPLLLFVTLAAAEVGFAQTKESVLISKESLLNWSKRKKETMDYFNRITVPPSMGKIMIDMKRTINEIDLQFLKINDLQNNLPGNRQLILSILSNLKQKTATIDELDTLLRNMEERLSTAGDDAQLANIDIQNHLQKIQQYLQMLSIISKMLHDTAMSTIQKMG